MQKTTLICEGKTKRLFATDEPELCVMEFKDEAMAFYGLKRRTIKGKGEMNNLICEQMFRLLAGRGVATHFVRRLSPSEMLVRRVDILPIAIVTRNIAAGDVCERTGIAPGTRLKATVVECHYKNNELRDPLVNYTHIAAMGLAGHEEMEIIQRVALTVNGILSTFLQSVNIDLVDFKLEFGRAANGEILLADEITPENCRFWDARTHEALDLDRFRQDLGDVREGYQKIITRVLRNDRNTEDKIQ